ncbi:hypothetical protein D3C75_993710 [compost metagenome]
MRQFPFQGLQPNIALLRELCVKLRVGCHTLVTQLSLQAGLTFVSFVKLVLALLHKATVACDLRQTQLLLQRLKGRCTLVKIATVAFQLCAPR